MKARTMLALRLLPEEGGVTAIEYGLIAALIALAIIVAVTLLGTNLAALFQAIADRIGGGGGPLPPPPPP